MSQYTFWTFARRLLRRKTLAAGTIVFSMVSAGGMAAGIVAIGPMLQLILGDGAGENLQSIVAAQVADKPWLGSVVPQALIDILPTDRFAGVALILAGLCALTVFGALTNFLHLYCSLTLATATVAEIRVEAFRHALRLPFGTVLRRGPTEIVSRIVRDTAELERGMTALTSKALAQCTKGIAAFIAAVWFDWRLTIAAIVVAPALAVVLRKFGKRIHKGSRKTLEAYEELLRVSNESMQGLRGVKTTLGEGAARRRFGRANRRVVREDRRVRMARAISSPLVELLAIVAISGMALVAAHEIIKGRMQFDRFLLSLGALGLAGSNLRPLAGLLNDVQAAAAPAERLGDILSVPGEGLRERDLPRLPRHTRSIEFRGVRFRYEGAEREALRGVDLRIAHGEFVAIVGPNGCGKTTLASLLPRIFDPVEGAVLVDGTDVRAANLRSLRAQIGVVPQEPLLVRGSIRENLLIGGAVSSEDALQRALELAHAANFVDRLPQGLDSMLGEGGSGLSGGQRQRLAIARALVGDPSILVLDEATSQIDAESEAQISAAIDDFRRGRTLIAIAHRLSTVRSADRIVVMEEGTVRDSGTHGELMERCELYQRLVNTQLVG
ncbi:MAG: ABC transporter ATP-binding protein/permease [Planctomycetaceae bacterium]|nr:ABC transporter ATP-binding protein/permease [Planctomycetaceae bacterium]